MADAGQQQPWQGGVNLTALALLEARAYGSYHFFRNHTPGNLTVGARDLLSLDYEAAASRHGLSKFVYLRDTRRAVGHNNFRLNHTAMVYANASRPNTGYEFADSESGVAHRAHNNIMCCSSLFLKIPLFIAIFLLLAIPE